MSVFSDLESVYERFIPWSDTGATGHLWGCWAELKLVSTSATGFAARCLDGRVLSARTSDLEIFVTEEHLGLASLVGLGTGRGKENRAVVALAGIDEEAAMILETRGILLCTLGHGLRQSLFEADNLAQAVYFLHLVYAYEQLREAEPEIMSPEDELETSGNLGIVRAITSDDFLPLYRHIPQDVMMGLGRVGGHSAAIVGHHRVLGGGLIEDDIEMLCRFLRLVRQRDHPLIWLEPEEIDPSVGAETRGRLCSELSMVRACHRTLILGDSSLPNYLPEAAMPDGSEDLFKLRTNDTERIETWAAWAGPAAQLS